MPTAKPLFMEITSASSLLFLYHRLVKGQFVLAIRMINSPDVSAGASPRICGGKGGGVCINSHPVSAREG